MKKNKIIFEVFLSILFLLISPYSIETLKTEHQVENPQIKENVKRQYRKIDNIETKVEEKNHPESSLISKKSTSSKKKTTTEKTTGTKKKKTTKVKTPKKAEKMGTQGRLYIGSVNLSVALYSANIYKTGDYNAQEIVDNKDSAAYFIVADKTIIADHNYQGFKKLINLSVGAKAQIKRADGSTISYTLKEKTEGKNLGSDLVDKNGISVWDKDGDIVMYTCYKSNKSIMITIWEEDK